MILICGAGITGLSIARELLNKGFCDITIIEKEKTLGKHASGRNSGVLHAGIYYTPDSLKAQCCLKGNRLMKQYCKEKGLTLIESGKVIVTKKESELSTLEELYRRAKLNGALVEIIDEKALKEIEPYAKTCKKALFSPETVIINPDEILNSLEAELSDRGVKILKGVHFTKIHDGTVYVGPTATPAFGRENYGIFDDIGFETLKILYRDFSLFISNEKFRNTAFTEVRKYFKKKFYEDVKDMIEGVGIEDLLPSNKAGIRPQLIDVNKKELVMDFLVIKDSNTIHILNAISPAFTSAFAFAEFIIKEYFMEKNNGKLV